MSIDISTIRAVAIICFIVAFLVAARHEMKAAPSYSWVFGFVIAALALLLSTAFIPSH